MVSPQPSPSVAPNDALTVDLAATFWFPLISGLLVGLILWILAESVRAWVGTVTRRRTRRRHIISLMGRAVALQTRALHDGRVERAWTTNTMSDLEELHERYDDLSAQALDLFEPGEEVVAFWTAVELYAGWEAPFYAFDANGTPRESGESGFARNPPVGTFWDPARPQELAEWAQVKWPWDRGSARGPRYADMFTPGDVGRHAIVPPNTGAPMGMIWPFVLYLGDKRGRDWFAQPSRREARRLKKLYPPSRYEDPSAPRAPEAVG